MSGFRPRQVDTAKLDLLSRALRDYIPEASYSTTILGKQLTQYFQEVHSAASDQRVRNYKIYDQMDSTDTIVSAVLNIYADEVTMGTWEGDVNKTYTVNSNDAAVLAIIDEVDRRTKMKRKICGFARSLVKYGDLFGELVIGDDTGFISRISILPPETMYVNVDSSGEFVDRESAAFSQVLEGISGEKIDFPWWKIVHWKREVDPSSVYGRSLLYSSRVRFFQLRQCIEGLVIERLLRAHQRRKYIIDTGDLRPDEAKRLVDEFKAEYRRRRVIDSSGELRLDNIPLAPEEDIFIPSGPSGKGNVEVLEGSHQPRYMDDMKLLINLYFAGFGVPKAYIGFEEGTHNRNVITQLDVQHARMVRSFQAFLIEGQEEIYRRQMALFGIDPTKVSFRIVYPLIRGEDDLRKWQIQNLKTRVAFMLRTQIGVQITDEWILRYLLELPEDELEVIGYDPNNTGLPPQYGGSPGEAKEMAEALKKKLLSGSLHDKRKLIEMIRDIDALCDLLDWKVSSEKGLRLKELQKPTNGKPSFVPHPENPVPFLRSEEPRYALYEKVRGS